MAKRSLICCLICCLSFIINAQETPKDMQLISDTTYKSPKTASILSAIIPGAGQIYNNKYWKAPIVWGGIGLSVYYIVFNTKKYKQYKDAYIARIDSDSTTVDMQFSGSDAQIQSDMEYYRRMRDISYIATAAIYTLNILDAAVDAHLKHFDINDDISARIRPTLLLNNNYNRQFGLQANAGIEISIRF